MRRDGREREIVASGTIARGTLAAQGIAWGAWGVRTLMQPVRGVSGLDVADDIAAPGRTREADPPNDDWGVAVAIASIAVLLAVLMLGLLYRIRTGPRPGFDR